MQFQRIATIDKDIVENRRYSGLQVFPRCFLFFFSVSRLLYFLSLKLSLTMCRCSKNYVAAIHDVMTRVFRLWAEVFHVNSSGGGTVKWQQVSEDLVPVNITCIQDSPECVFHITAYNSQVDKILDVRLVQPGEP